jgi:O-antigen biosynthesis protein
MTPARPAAPATLPADRAAAGPGIVVLGMHRSGTSLVTGILQRLGGRLCQENDLLSCFEHGQLVNYGESRSIVLFNESLLRAFGGDWAVPPILESGWWTSPQVDELARAAAGVFTRTHPRAGWLCKDPRFCLTLPFWRTWAIPDVRAVLVVRHPAEVAASLARRDGVGAGHAAWLWQQYISSAVRACRDVPALVVSYAQLCRDPFGTGELLAAWTRPAGRTASSRIRHAVAAVRSDPAQPAGRGDPVAATSQGAGTRLYDLIADLHGHCLGPVPATNQLETS